MSDQPPEQRPGNQPRDPYQPASTNQPPSPYQSSPYQSSPGQQSGASQPPGGYRPPDGYDQAPSDPTQTTSILAILGLVLAFLLAPVGLVLSVLALPKTGRGRQKGRGLAIAGVIVSIFNMILGIVLIAAIIQGVSAGSDQFREELERFEEEMAELETEDA